MTEAQNILLKYWGFQNFRPQQEEIIKSILNGNDTLGLLPTGGGKSICFQVPALMMDGLCIVVTPLIALMKDQVEKLKQQGIKAAAIFSGMNRYEMDVVIDNCLFGDMKFLYVSPERLETDLILKNVNELKVNLLAVDEAHCISQWGYDFRPSYLNIANIRKYFPKTPVLALTATATQEVVKDIQEQLLFKKENIFQLSFQRKNLVYVVQYEENKLERLIKIASRIQGTGIIYVRNRKKTIEIAEYLGKRNIQSHFYHAGLEMKVRDKKQNDWMNGMVRIMVATNAFGMGIDKSNVRFVTHFDIPDSIEAYFQEAGRAGRDGRNSYAVLLYDNADVVELKKSIQVNFPPLSNIADIYDSLGNYFQLAIGSGQDVSFEFDIHDFISQYNYKYKPVTAALSILEKESYIMLNHVLHAESSVHFIVKKDDLYKFQVEHKNMDTFIKMLLRSYSGIFTDFVRINEKLIASRLNTTVEKIVKMLEYLDNSKIIVYIKKKNKPGITFCKERIRKKDIYISPENYDLRKKIAQKKIDAIINYVNESSHCRSQILLSYFNEFNSSRCGYCDVCVKRNKIELSKFDFDQILKEMKPMLLDKPMSLEEISLSLRNISEDKIIKVMQWLLDNNKVEYKEGKKLFWKT